MCMSPAPSNKAKSKQELDYRAEEDFRTLERAEEVLADTARHTRAMGHARKKMRAMSRVVGRGGSARASVR